MKRIVTAILAVLMLTSTAYAAPRPEPICPEGAYADEWIKDTHLTVTNKASTGKPYLTWDAIGGAERYYVYYRTDASKVWKQLYKTKGTHLTHSSCIAGDKYQYMVMTLPREELNIGESYSNTVWRTCDLPRPTLTVSTSHGYPRLTWTGHISAKAYQVWYKTPGEGYRLLYTAHGTSLNHRSAEDGVQYTYRVRALYEDSAANSAYSYTRTVRG